MKLKILRPACLLFMILIVQQITMAVENEVRGCMRQMYPTHVEQKDNKGFRCWDHIKMPVCRGRCDSKEIADWVFPFKISHHSVCMYGSKRLLKIRLRHCDTGVDPVTEIFHFISPTDCHCKICSSQYTSCEWLPPNTTLLEQFTDYENKNIKHSL